MKDWFYDAVIWSVVLGICLVVALVAVKLGDGFGHKRFKPIADPVPALVPGR